MQCDQESPFFIDTGRASARNPPMKFDPLDFSKIRTYPVAERANKVNAASFARPHSAGGSLRGFLDSLPDFLAVRDLREIASAVAAAVRASRPVALMMGAHSIKVGLN